MNTLRRSFVDTRVGQLHVVRTGAGRPVVMLPGAGQSHNQLRRLMTQLAPRFEAVVIDAPGSGYSGPLPDEVTMPLLADALVDAIHALGLQRPCVYGIHTGNKLAASIGARHAAEISSVVFCGQSHSLIADFATRVRRIKEAASTSHAQQPADDGSDATRLLIADHLLATASLPKLYEANLAYDLEADLRRIGVPTLVVEIATPQEDRSVGRQGPILTGLIPRAELVTFEEPDGLGLTLENRAAELAECIASFASDAFSPAPAA